MKDGIGCSGTKNRNERKVENYRKVTLILYENYEEVLRKNILTKISESRESLFQSGLMFIETLEVLEKEGLKLENGLIV